MFPLLKLVTSNYVKFLSRTHKDVIFFFFYCSLQDYRLFLVGTSASLEVWVHWFSVDGLELSSAFLLVGFYIWMELPSEFPPVGSIQLYFWAFFLCFMVR